MLLFDSEFPVGATTLKPPRHRGGTVDWFSASAPTSVPVGPGAALDGRAFPTALQYLGAPNSGWWEIEDAAVDIAGYPPDSSHFPTTLLIDLICSHSDDWFLFPIDVAAGSLLDLASVTVTDSFGVSYDVTRPADPWCCSKPQGWRRRH